MIDHASAPPGTAAGEPTSAAQGRVLQDYGAAAAGLRGGGGGGARGSAAAAAAAMRATKKRVEEVREWIGGVRRPSFVGTRQVVKRRRWFCSWLCKNDPTKGRPCRWKIVKY